MEVILKSIQGNFRTRLNSQLLTIHHRRCHFHSLISYKSIVPSIHLKHCFHKRESLALFSTLKKKSNISVIQDKDKHQFLAFLTNKEQVGYLKYTILSDGVIDLQSTFTSPSGRGLGIAGQLCDEAFEYAKKHDLCVQPTCSYIRDTYLTKIRPEFQILCC